VEFLGRHEPLPNLEQTGPAMFAYAWCLRRAILRIAVRKDDTRNFR
jgi:hypothetical protein